MESWTADQLRTFRHQKLRASIKSTGSVELRVGHLLSDSQDGQTIDQSGPGHAHASHSQPLESEKPSQTTGISGQTCSGLSTGGNLSRSLASRLAARFASVGSMEYVQTWKERVTPAGRSYSEHTASAPRTFAKDSTGWPTPAVQNADGVPNPHGNTGEHFTLQTAAGMAGWPTPKLPRGGPEMQETRDARGAGGIDLQSVAVLTGWATPQTNDAEKRGQPSLISGQQTCLPVQSQLTGWVSPSSRDWKDTPGMSTNGVNPDGTTRNRTDQLPRQVHGLTSESCPAQTGSRGVLEAAFSRWLMGFPAKWDEASPNYHAWCEVQDRIVQAV